MRRALAPGFRTQLIGALLTFESQLARRSLGVAHMRSARSCARCFDDVRPLAELVGQRRSCPVVLGTARWSVRTGRVQRQGSFGHQVRGWWRLLRIEALFGMKSRSQRRTMATKARCGEKSWD